mmetsp:Transcript_22940/g.17386  ORF Transcript_22940/g.17386 Transcript_22940/m.17386 type:complete len:112 (+) Transcript_22940:219-554(+)|eukprot:CAMPEP_0202965604 /NCGR_PEP_ID=MMETSP1396-20130829/9520_1 /ASSEMBLY_ACC=CAM_ASM_000872 /TAXON_ID= /ORGANISM="Pseudokeronopsis sp., Strain Brazil" /LENGTH=111 /DNA_ID=CAMNT_0049688367 /DNA_START=1630 /DNA_END=1965 /DNA_ORIENTATION=-
MGEVIEDVIKEEECEDEEYYYDEYASEYGDEVGALRESFCVEVDLGGGLTETIKLTEQEYIKIFEGGEQGLLIEKVKELQRAKGMNVSNMTNDNTHFSNKASSANNSMVMQ